MKLSVCIPIHNYYAYPLVESLAAQCAGVDGCKVEIVCIDDCSTQGYRERNRGIEEIARCVYLDENIGRARIRNLFLEHTDGEYLVFLDNDMNVRDGYLKRYAEMALQGAAVVVGGISYSDRNVDAAHKLRLMYGLKVESSPAAERSRTPYRSFMTGNFMIRRDVLDEIRFDERLRRYGHEDTLFGYELERREVEITHIDNPAVNGRLESNDEFLAKSREAVENLAYIYTEMGVDAGFARSVRLLGTYVQLRKAGLAGLVCLAYRMLRRPMETHLLAGQSFSLAEFSFYKLGCLVETIKKQKKTNINKN